ncbi:caspase family protein [Nostoc sp. XA010]|uniref:caspase family protein n=1 Tax=Nostoc sp. XA010 TaxID=2780407 RepID=UPI001E2AEA69|nr:caspase family protein [Nostoc sp. XA010]MCC5662279.1 caspase family protein [Nostoc sp. XA010]
MSPLYVGSSYSTNILTTGEAKLWILLVGVNEYQDSGLPSLRYPAVDCQGLGKALLKATQRFPNKEVIIHNDFAAQPPTLEIIRGSLQRIISQTQSQDSIVLYFSGHGMLEPNDQQAVLCLADTCKDDLLSTGLGLQELLQVLGSTSATQQLVCLDTCHSGAMKVLGANAGSARDGNISETLFNTQPTLMQVLRKRASQSKEFCALLSCDQGQQSWEFPELGHGLFTYYLMQGLLGKAADSQGVIEADGLYKYVYRQTLQYIDKLNQQLRLMNQQKLNRGDSKLHPEYPLQTPKRIVEGVGELILGFKADAVESHKQRRALVIDGLANKKTTTDLSRLFAGAGGFEVEFFPQQGKSRSEIPGKIQNFLHWSGESATKSVSQLGTIKNAPTSLLYLRGHIEKIEDGEAWLVLGNAMRLSRSWLRHQLRRAAKSQQIIILDFPEATFLEDWIEDLQSGTEHGQCIIVGASTDEEPELFSQTLLETLIAANPQAGLGIAKWITQLQTHLPTKGVNLDVWLSATQTVIDILPGNIGIVFQDLQVKEVPLNEENKRENQENLFPKDVNNLPKLEFASQFSSQPFPDQPVSVAAPIAADYLEKTQPQLNFKLDSEQYSKLEQLLKLSVGLIAPTILKKTLKKATSSKELVKKITTYLLPEQQQTFEQQAIAILEQSTVASQSTSDNSSSIDPKFIRKCERELAYAIGPIANFLTQEILKSYPQISLLEFVSKLATKISDKQKALEFEQRMLGNLK